MAHWNPYYDGSNHIYQEQNPQINYAGVPFQQLAYNDYYIPNVTNYNTNSTDFTSRASYIDSQDYSGDAVPNHNLTDYMSGSNRNSNRPNRNASGPHRNTSEIDYNVGALNYNNTPVCVPNSSSYNPNSSEYDTSRYNPNLSDFNTTGHNTNNSGYDVNVSNHKINNSGYNKRSYDYNSKTTKNSTKTSQADSVPNTNYKSNYNNKSVRVHPVEEFEQFDSSRNSHNRDAYVSNLTPTATEFTPSTSWQKPILTQTFNSSSYKEPGKQTKKNVEKNSENVNDEKKSGNFMRFTNRKYNDRYKPNDKFKNGSYKRNRDDSSQNSSESSSYNNSQRDYYSNKNNRYKNYGDSTYNRNYQDKNER